MIGRILTSEKFNDINTFEKPNTVKNTDFNGAKINGNELIVEMPSKSIVALELK